MRTISAGILNEIRDDRNMLALLRKIRYYGGVAKFIENCDNQAEVDLVRKYMGTIGEWDKQNIAFKKKGGQG